METTKANFHDHYLTLAKRLFAERYIDAAFHALKKKLIFGPGSTAGVSLLGHIGLVSGSGERALKGFRRAILLDGRNDPRVWMNYGNALAAVNRGSLAVDIYHTVLRLDPDHVSAKAQLAVWYLEVKEASLAKPYVSELFDIQKLPPSAALRLANALRVFGARDSARHFYNRAIGPNLSISRAAYFGRAMVSRRLQTPAPAVADFQRALVLGPNDIEIARQFSIFALNAGLDRAAVWGMCALCHGDADAYILKGLLDVAVARSDETAASRHLRELIAIAPEALTTQVGRIEVLRLRNDVSGLEDMAAALPFTKRTSAGLWNNLLLALRELGSDEAGFYGELALKAYPSEAVLWFNQGLFHFHCDAYDQALGLFRKAMLLVPGYAKALNQASVCISGLYNNEEAEALVSRCLCIRPNHSLAWMHRGLYAKARGRLLEGITYLRQAITMAGGDYPDANYNLALHLLAVGKIEDGYSKYRDRWLTSAFAKERRDFPQPEWPGPKAAPNSSILVFMEQGMGDEVLYSWILPWVRDDCSDLTVECDVRLVEIFQRTFPEVTFVPRLPIETRKLKQRNFDYHLPLVQAAEFYAERIHCEIAALSAGNDLRGRRVAPRLCTDPVRLAYWQKYLADTFGDRLTVGVAWRSGMRTRLRNQQYLTPEELARALPPGIAVINLQYDHTEEEAVTLITAGEREGFVFETPPGINLRDDLDDIFALTEALDLVVSPLISTPWMAAAVGTPSLVFRSNENGQIWLQFSQRYIPWAPNIKLFFRSPKESWDGPIAGIRADVARQLAG